MTLNSYFTSNSVLACQCEIFRSSTHVTDRLVRAWKAWTVTSRHPFPLSSVPQSPAKQTHISIGECSHLYWESTFADGDIMQLQTYNLHSSLKFLSDSSMHTWLWSKYLFLWLLRLSTPLFYAFYLLLRYHYVGGDRIMTIEEWEWYLSALNMRSDWFFLVYLSLFYRAMLAQSAVMRLLSSVCPSVCPSVTFRYRVQIRWNSSKIISRPNSLGTVCWLTPNIGDLVQPEHPQNWGWIGVG